MNELSDSIVGLWIVFFLILIAGVIASFWWIMRTKNMKLRSSAPANDGEQRHDEFITTGASEVPPDVTHLKQH